MSTQSFLKGLNLSSRRKVSNLVNAIERSEKNFDRQIVIQKAVNELNGEQAKAIARKIKWTV